MHVRIALPVLAAAGALLACGPAASDSTALQASAGAISGAAVAPGNAGGNKVVAVMDWNLYVGASVEAILQAPSPEAIPLLAAQAWATVQATDFDERAEAIADHVAEHRPVVVGLQEAALWRTQSPADGSLLPNADHVEYDYLEILLGALAARGLEYDLASVVENVDLEVPVPVSLQPLELLDVRVTDRDAVLVRRDVRWANALAEHFVASMPVVIGDPAAPLLAFDYLRGWNRVDVEYRGEWFRFLNTHLEAFDPAVRLDQSEELVALVEDSPLPVIAVGDFNAQEGSAPYAELTSALADAWLDSGAEGPGYTCCSNDPALRDTAAVPFDERIDLVLYTAPFVPLDATVVGDELADLTATGMWPSDHAGVVAKLRYVEPRFYALQP